jgi:hypothetical protein
LNRFNYRSKIANAAAILVSGGGQKLKNGGSPYFSGDRY